MFASASMMRTGSSRVWAARTTGSKGVLTRPDLVCSLSRISFGFLLARPALRRTGSVWSTAGAEVGSGGVPVRGASARPAEERALGARCLLGAGHLHRRHERVDDVVCPQRAAPSDRVEVSEVRVPRSGHIPRQQVRAQLV